MSINPYNWEAQNQVLFPNGKLMAGLMYIKDGDDYIAWDGSVEVVFSATSLAINNAGDTDVLANVVESTDEPGTFGLVVLNPDGSEISGGGGGGGAVTIADGADVVEGELADAAVTGDNTGTISAKLRGINKILADVWDSVNNRFNVFVENATLAVTQSGSWVISAGSAIIGSVTINRTTPGTTNTVAPINGQDGVQGGSGTVNALTQRVVLATDVALPAGTNAIGTVKAQGTVADDNDTPGDPVLIGGWAKSPDGTDPGNVSAEGDAVRAITDLNRIIYVNTNDPTTKHANFTETDDVTGEVIAAAPGAGFRHIITRVRFSSGDAVAFELGLFDEDSNLLAGGYYVEAAYGRGFMFDCYIPAPANKGIEFTVNGSGAGVYTVSIEWITKKV